MDSFSTWKGSIFSVSNSGSIYKQLIFITLSDIFLIEDIVNYEIFGLLFLFVSLDESQTKTNLCTCVAVKDQQDDLSICDWSDILSRSLKGKFMLSQFQS